MDKAKVQDIINGLVLSNRVERQYPASKKNITKLEELGLIEFMPICNHPSVRAIGQTDANIVIAEATKAKSGAMNAYGEGEDLPASDLYRAINS